MKLSKIGSTTERGTLWLASGGKQIAAVILFLMMLLVAVDVAARYLFNNPIYGAMEIEELMMVFVVFLSLAYCTLAKGQIVVDLVVSRVSQRLRTILDTITSFASAGIVALIVWRMGLRGWQELLSPSGQISTLLNVPLAPFILLATIGTVLLCLVLLMNCLHSLAQVMGKKENK
jgi:TRAP-type C4-dicarboxylate transport system permease small subunit